MPRKMDIKIERQGRKKIVLKRCTACKEYKPIEEFPVRKYKGKDKIYPKCKECELKRTRERRNKPKTKDTVKRYTQSRRGRIKQKINDYLYKRDEKFIKSKKILVENGEREVIGKKYKRNYIIFNVPSTILSDEDKAYFLGFESVEALNEYKRINSHGR